jgi:thiol-disulfide isomerase/thioredoxin
MQNRSRPWLVVLLSAFGTAFGGFLPTSMATEFGPASPVATVEIGAKIDGFRLTDFQGKEWTHQEFQAKKAIVFAFVGTQCPLAKLYSAKLVELEKRYRDQGVAFVAVDSNVQDSLAEMTAHARKFGAETIGEDTLFGQVYNRMLPQLPASCSSAAG